MRVEAIYNTEDIISMYKAMTSSRNKVLFMLGISTGYRIGDLLRLRKSDVLGDVIVVKEEQKTGKKRFVGVTAELRALLDNYLWRLEYDEDYLFPSQKANDKGEYVISTTQAYRIIKDAAKRAEIDLNVGSHTLRKTWAYHMYKKENDVAFLMDALGHSTQAMTLKYIGASQQEIVDRTANLSFGIAN